MLRASPTRKKLPQILAVFVARSKGQFGHLFASETDLNRLGTRGSSRWQITLCERILNPGTTLIDGMLRFATLRSELVRDLEFDSPEDAEAYVERLLAA